jgi:hypothetical protein
MSAAIRNAQKVMFESVQALTFANDKKGDKWLDQFKDGIKLCTYEWKIKDYDQFK